MTLFTHFCDSGSEDKDRHTHRHIYWMMNLIQNFILTWAQHKLHLICYHLGRQKVARKDPKWLILELRITHFLQQSKVMQYHFITVCLKHV